MIDTHIQRTCIVVFTLFSFLFSTCKKTSRDNRSIQIKLSTEGLAYVQLSPEKYFIYKDSASGKLDSTVVTKSLLENRYTPGFNGGLFASYPPFYSEVFSLTLTKIDGGIQTIWFKAKNRAADCCPSISHDNEPIKMYDTSNILAFYYPDCSCDLVQLFPSLTVEGKAYNNVIQAIDTRYPDPDSFDYIQVLTYWAKGVGIIKRTQTDSSGTRTYNLVRNN